jgi:NADPH:quinone reductase-like Zn-dependent oxidoreductase
MARKASLEAAAAPQSAPPAPSVRPPPGPYMQEVAELARAGKFTVHIDRTYPLAEVAQAQEYSHARHTEGKIILIVSDQAKSH